MVRRTVSPPQISSSSSTSNITSTTTSTTGEDIHSVHHQSTVAVEERSFLCLSKPKESAATTTTTTTAAAATGTANLAEAFRATITNNNTPSAPAAAAFRPRAMFRPSLPIPVPGSSGHQQQQQRHSQRSYDHADALLLADAEYRHFLYELEQQPVLDDSIIRHHYNRYLVECGEVIVGSPPTRPGAWALLPGVQPIMQAKWRVNNENSAIMQSNDNNDEQHLDSYMRIYASLSNFPGLMEEVGTVEGGGGEGEVGEGAGGDQVDSGEGGDNVAVHRQPLLTAALASSPTSPVDDDGPLDPRSLEVIRQVAADLRRISEDFAASRARSSPSPPSPTPPTFEESLSTRSARLLVHLCRTLQAFTLRQLNFWLLNFFPWH